MSLRKTDTGKRTIKRTSKKFKVTVLSALLCAAYPLMAYEQPDTPVQSETQFYRILPDGTYRVYRIEAPAIIEILPEGESPDAQGKTPGTVILAQPDGQDATGSSVAPETFYGQHPEDGETPKEVFEGAEDSPDYQISPLVENAVPVLEVSEPEVVAQIQQTETRPEAAFADYYLDVVLNTVPTNLLVNFKQTTEGHWLLSDEDRRELGLLPPNDIVASAAGGWVNLSALAGVSTRYEEDSQTLHIHAQAHALIVKRFDVRNAERNRRLKELQDQGGAESPRDFGAFVNHTLYYSSGGERWDGVYRYQNASAMFEGNLYGPFGNLTSNQIINANRVGLAGGRKVKTTRLDTQWSWFDEERLMTATAGDFVGSSLSWSRATRLGGFQLRRNFSIRPDLVTMPMLTDLSGSAAVPSTVELYINNARRFTQDVTPGPFAITNLPLITGSGTARMVVRDALGRETISETPFYASSKLLAKGLADFAVEGGFARRNYGVLSNDYDSRFFVSGTGRYGLNNATTLEGVAQGGGRLALLGTGGVFRLGTVGVAGLSGTFSRYGSKSDGTENGSQWAASFETQLAGFRINARHQKTFGKFNDIASITVASRGTSALSRLRARPASSMSQVSVSLPQFSWGAYRAPSVNFSYTPITQSNGSRSRLAGVNIGQRLPWNGWLSISGYKDLERKNSGTVFAMLSWFLGDRINASASYSKSQGNKANTTFDLSRSEQSQFNSVGWRLRSSQGMSRSQAASASYRTRMGRFEAGVEHMESSKRVNGRLQMDGATVLAGGGAFLTNRVYNSFGVVNVGAPDVEVKYENNPVGKTNSDGRILLTGLRPYEPNLISIDPMTLPVDADIPVLKRVVSPRWRSGISVNFDVALQTRTALVTLKDESGKELAVGSEVRLNDAADFVVGYDGQVWLEDIAEQNRLVVQRTGKPACVVEFSAPKEMTERLVVSDLTCKSS